jgi:hypothetical protein
MVLSIELIKASHSHGPNPLSKSRGEQENQDGMLGGGHIPHHLVVYQNEEVATGFVTCILSEVLL